MIWPAVLLGLALAVAAGARVPAALPPARWGVPVAAAAAGALLGPVAAVAAAGLAVVGTRGWEGQRARRRADEERASAVEAVAVLAAELRAGRTPAEALAAAASVGTAGVAAGLAAAGRAALLGADPAAVLRDAARSSAAAQSLVGLAACLHVCGSSGAGLAAATDAVADALRLDQELRQEVDAELAGPRATAGMLALLPVAGCLLAAGLGARPLHVLLHTTWGAACLLLGIGLDLLGLWWTGRLVAAVTR